MFLHFVCLFLKAKKTKWRRRICRLSRVLHGRPQGRERFPAADVCWMTSRSLATTLSRCRLPKILQLRLRGSPVRQLATIAAGVSVQEIPAVRGVPEDEAALPAAMLREPFRNPMQLPVNRALQAANLPRIAAIAAPVALGVVPVMSRRIKAMKGAQPVMLVLVPAWIRVRRRRIRPGTTVRSRVQKAAVAAVVAGDQKVNPVRMIVEVRRVGPIPHLPQRRPGTKSVGIASGNQAAKIGANLPQV
jgi:hypothetical protein